MLYRNRISIARWVLWGILLAAALVLQATVCNRLPVFGAVPVLMPVAVVCVAMMGSAESGAVVGLVGGLMAYLGGDASAFVIPVLCFAGALSGGLCTIYFTRSLPPALLMAAIALVLCAVPTWALEWYLGHVPLSAAWEILLPELVYSLLYTLPLYWLSWRVSLLGRR